MTLIHGDGVGPELMQHVKAAMRFSCSSLLYLILFIHFNPLIRCVRAPVEFEDIPLSSHVASDELFERAVMAVRRNGIAIKGCIAFIRYRLID